ncbi:chaperonin 10-like protein [Alternaria rosae]|uniref:chaperonin 10-like protein n=1 Tax=Alternaria rosae TaxID=1187941 RepID=UPI001E8CF320|nr:chaperonin 10-like protein [Alternaria rosae]KAH6857428.1 chaperonin 10-like protein [Alternaria rosae]
MSVPQNQVAWLDKAGAAFRVGDTSIPTADAGEIIVKNAAVAINPLNCHMQDLGIFVQQWPAVFGCDVAVEFYKAGPDVTRFNKGDRVIGHTVNLVSGHPQDGGYALYTVVPADKVAILPNAVSFTDGVVVPFAIEAAVCAMSLKVPGQAMPGVSTPALGLPYPSLSTATSIGKTLVVYGGSSSAGSMVTQVASSAGIHVIAIAGAHKFDLNKRSGAVQVFYYKDDKVMDNVVEAVKQSGNGVVGILDAIATAEPWTVDLAILEKLGGGHLACSQPPPTGVPENVKAGMIFAVNDIATPVWNAYVTPALQAGKLFCLTTPTVVGKGLKFIQEALNKSSTGGSGTKIVVEL